MIRKIIAKEKTETTWSANQRNTELLIPLTKFNGGMQNQNLALIDKRDSMTNYQCTWQFREYFTMYLNSAE